MMIPVFIAFVPFGVVQFLKKRTKETNFIIVYLAIISLPILYGYIMQAQDTRYLYILFPIFSLISLFAVDRYITKFSNKNIILFLMIAGILIGSISFYEYKKVDYEKEKELNEIAKKVSSIAHGVNYHELETRYIRAAEIPNTWPFLFTDEMYQIKTIPTENHKNLKSFISNSKEDLTHIIVDESSQIPEFLQQVYQNEKEYEYLRKVFDSTDEGYNHHVILFEIDFEEFNLIGKR